MSSACLNKSVLMICHLFFILKSKWVGDYVFSIGKQGNEMKCWECEGGRLTELQRVVSSIPNMPTHIKPRINAVSVYSQRKTPQAKFSAKSAASAPHKYTPVTFINFRHLRTEKPANKNSSNPLVSQQKQQRWIMCLRHLYKNQAKICLNSRMLAVWVERNIFNLIFSVIFIRLFCI